MIMDYPALPTVADYVPNRPAVRPLTPGEMRRRWDPGYDYPTAPNHPVARAWVTERVRDAALNTGPILGHAAITTASPLLITGRPGTGKTIEIAGVLAALSSSGAIADWVYTTADDLIASCRQQVDLAESDLDTIGAVVPMRETPTGSAEVIDRFEVARWVNVPILAIDGAPPTRSIARWHAAVFASIVQRRVLARRPTVVAVIPAPVDDMGSEVLPYALLTQSAVADLDLDRPW